MHELDAAVQRFAEKLGDVARAFNEVAEGLAMSNLPSAELWVAGQSRRHYADPELTAPAWTEGER